MTGPTGAPCVVSVAEHAGWAHVISVAAVEGIPAVVDRRRVSVTEAGVPTQPYHHDSLGLPLDAADALVQRVRRSVEARTVIALREVISALAPAYRAVTLAIRQSPYPFLPDSVADVRRSYPLQCAADGMVYQNAMCRAAQEQGLTLYVYGRGEETELAAQELGIAVEEVADFVSGRGRPAGPPWTQEHRRAYAAGIAALAVHLPLRIGRTAARP